MHNKIQGIYSSSYNTVLFNVSIDFVRLWISLDFINHKVSVYKINTNIFKCRIQIRLKSLSDSTLRELRFWFTNNDRETKGFLKLGSLHFDRDHKPKQTEIFLEPYPEQRHTLIVTEYKSVVLLQPKIRKAVNTDSFYETYIVPHH